MLSTLLNPSYWTLEKPMFSVNMCTQFGLPFNGGTYSACPRSIDCRLPGCSLYPDNSSDHRNPVGWLGCKPSPGPTTPHRHG